VPLCIVYEVENKINRARIYFEMPAEHDCKGRTEEREARSTKVRSRCGYLSLARFLFRPVLRGSIVGTCRRLLQRFETRMRERGDRGTQRVLGKVDGYDVATVALALAARTAADRVAVS
jgi:hypothetical protein